MTNLRNYTFYKVIEDSFNEGVKLVTGAKVFGEEIDVTNLEEVVAALYIMYTYKEFMVKVGEDDSG